MEEKEKSKKNSIRITIGKKILGGFSAFVGLFIINTAIIFVTGNKIDSVVEVSSKNIQPSQNSINEFVLMVTRSKMLITNWVYLQTNNVDKQALMDLQNMEYPTLKEKLQKLMPLWESDSQRMLMDTVFIRFETMIEKEKQIMQDLNSFESYEDPIVKLMAEDAIEGEVIPRSAEIIGILKKIATFQGEVTLKADEDLVKSTGNLRYITLILAVIITIVGFLSAFLLMRSITVPVNFLKNVVLKLGRGELTEEKQSKFSNDEIGEMAQAVDNLVQGLRATTLFAENIGKGNYQSSFTPLSEHDVLGNALINMRENLAKVSDDDKKRNWTTGGMAKFGEILRTRTNDIALLTEDILRNLVKYLQANQGALYIIDDDGAEADPTMSVKACYAWDRKKFINHKIHKGEGLAGQVWQEGEYIYLTEVPQEYIKITSGLGDANPTCVLIVPLKVNDQIFGIVEIASFQDLKDFEIEFVRKIAESIASTISSVKINARTQRLLEESQEMTEQMRAQEEEMRQNMEELQATQEEISRNQAESENVMQSINDFLLVAEYDIEGKCTKINGNYLKLMGYTVTEVTGDHHRIFVTKEEKGSDEYRQFWKNLNAGLQKEGEYKRVNRRGDLVTLHSIFSPVKSRTGEVIKVMEISYVSGKA